MSETQDAAALLDKIDELAGGSDTVSVRDMVDAIGHRGFGPLLFVPALVVVSPLGAIPGVPTLFAIVILLISAQILFGRQSIWLPDVIGARDVAAEKVSRAVEKARPAAERLDRWFGSRLEWLISDAARIAAASAALALCAVVPPLELVPLAAMVPMLAVAVIGLALTARDGVLMLIGLGGAAAALITAVNMLISG